MAVIGYQIIIISSIVVLYVFKRNWAIKACIFWSIETILFLWHPPLIIIQLIVVWGTWFLLKRLTRQKEKIAKQKEKIAKQKEKIKKLEQEIKRVIADKPVYIKEIVREVPINNFRILAQQEHLDFLQNTIKEAKRHVVILSGWISKYVVDDKFLNMLKKALSRGVNIYIGYGYRNSNNKHKEFKGADEKQVVRKLLYLLNGKFLGEIFIGEFPNHEKILIKDSEFVVYGSNNWLTNKRFVNSERSVVIFSPKLAKKEFERISSLIKENEV